MTSDGESPWYVSAFRADYRRVYAHRDLDAARAEVRFLLRQGLESPVLDLGAGFGRHTLALREQGARAFGMDLSEDLLRDAAGTAAEGPLVGRMARGDFRHLPYRSASFGSVAMLFSSFGYFGDDENRAVLGEVARVLRPGGRAVFDLMNAERIRRTLVPRSVRTQGGYELTEERRLTEGGRRVTKTVRMLGPGGERSWGEDVRLFDPSEFDGMCRDAGLAVEERHGDFTDGAFVPDSPRQLVWVKRESPGPA